MSVDLHAPCIEPSQAPDQRIDISHVDLSVGSVDLIMGRHVRLPGTPHFHDFFAVGVVDRGCAQIRYRSTNAAASPGALMTITAGEVHASGPPRGTAWSYRVIFLQRGLLRDALGEAIDDERILFPSAFAVDGIIAAMFERTYETLALGDCRLAAEESLLGFLRAVSERYASTPPTPGHRHHCTRVAVTARDFMESHFAERIDLATLAAICGVSSFHLIRAFRREFGMPPHGYLKQLRVARALTLLRQGLRATSVAYRCGFSDQSHLTKNFRSVFGLPPGAYQRAVGAVPSAIPTASLRAD